MAIAYVAVDLADNVSHLHAVDQRAAVFPLRSQASPLKHQGTAH